MQVHHYPTITASRLTKTSKRTENIIRNRGRSQRRTCAAALLIYHNKLCNSQHYTSTTYIIDAIDSRSININAQEYPSHCWPNASPSHTTSFWTFYTPAEPSFPHESWLRVRQPFRFPPNHTLVLFPSWLHSSYHVSYMIACAISGAKNSTRCFQPRQARLVTASWGASM